MTIHEHTKKISLKSIQNHPQFNRGIAALLILALVLTGYYVFSSIAATNGPFLSLPAGSSLATAGATINNDSTASSGKNLQFNAASNGTVSWWKPAQNTRWQWVLEGGITTTATNLSQFDMYDIDLTDAIPQTTTQTVASANGETRTITWPQGANAAAFTTLKAAGKKVICYMDTGAFETYEPDASLFPGKWGSGSRGTIPYSGPSAFANADVIGGLSQASDGSTFAGEYWMDIRQPAWQYYAPIIWARLDLAKKIGCDGVEGDQNNVYGNDSTFGVTQADSLRWYREVYYQTHLRGLTAISKNGIELTSQQIAEPTNISYCKPGQCVPDGILNEECQQYSECTSLDPATKKGLWVGQVEYRGTAATVCPSAKSAGRMAMKKPENYSVTESILFTCW